MQEAVDIARRAVEVAVDKQATEIVLLELTQHAFTDYFVILSAESARQIDAVADELEKSLTSEGASLHHREGKADSGWVLLDFGDVIVHVFAPAQREYYDLERVWSRATPLLKIQ
ncbi:MAG: ribosome silencing factor [Chloroflexi bacterium]|nr:ribosome silencing factor [Chloroflexota bacterium]